MEALGVGVKQPVGACAPHIINITLPQIKSETMLHFLSARGVCVSAGSACAAHGKKTSRALAGFGATAAEADSSLRISLSPYTTEQDLDVLRDALDAGLKTLVRIRR
jgi:cysteine desulfurase